MHIQERLAQYARVPLTVDRRLLSESEYRIIPLLIEAARAMDDAFWMQAYGDRARLMAATADPGAQQYIQISYGPWDRLRGNEPFVAGVGAMPPGANFYPPDMTSEEFEASATVRPDLKSMYTMVRRDIDGTLVAIPYYQYFHAQVERAVDKLRQAARLAEQATLQAYLNTRADALLTDEYRASEFAWMDMKDNTIDILIGPMETSADRLFWQKAAYAATILIKDWHWSQQVTRYTQLLSRFQDHLPVPDVYKREQPGVASDLNVYDVVYCAGYDNVSIPIGVSWPDDEDVRIRTGTRSLQLKNVMRAKFEQLLAPMADVLIARNQRRYVTFDAYFHFVMFHEIAHGLGIKHTITDEGLVKDALKDHHYAIEESKANILSMVVLTQLHQSGEVSETKLREVYVTALVHLLHTCDSRQALMQLNVFKELGAYSRDAGTKTYRVNMERMPAALTALAERLLRFQGDGDYVGAKSLMDCYARPDDDLTDDVERLDSTGLPIEIVLEQEGG